MEAALEQTKVTLKLAQSTMHPIYTDLLLCLDWLAEELIL